MIRLSGQDLAACSLAVRELHAQSSLEEFWTRALATIADLVPVEHVSFNHFTPQTRQLSARQYPDRPDLKLLLPYLTPHYHTHPLFVQPPGALPQTISETMSLRQFKETAVYREYYRLIKVTDQMVLTIEDRQDCQIKLALNRFGQPFSSRDRNVVAFLSPHVSQAFHNARIKAEMILDLEGIGEGFGAMNRAVILVTNDGRIRWLSAMAREWLAEFFPDYLKSSPHLPSALMSRICLPSHAKQEEGKRFREFQFFVGPLDHVTACCGATCNGMAAIVLRRERMGIEPAAAASMRLTPRESEIFFWISEGKADREIATILGISHRTVHKHVEHLFAKLGIANRSAAQRLGLELRQV